jgi:hypothetical protein
MNPAQRTGWLLVEEVCISQHEVRGQVSFHASPHLRAADSTYIHLNWHLSCCCTSTGTAGKLLENDLHMHMHLHLCDATPQDLEVVHQQNESQQGKGGISAVDDCEEDRCVDKTCQPLWRTTAWVCVHENMSS